MPIATFQKKVFQVSSDRKYTFNGLTWGAGLDTEAQEKLKDKPSTYIKGIGLNTLSIEITLRQDFGMNVRAEIEQWEAIRDKQIPDYFILGTKPVSKNKFLLKSVTVSDPEIDGRGRILKASLKLEFEEYVRAGKAQSKSGGAGGLAMGSTLTPLSYTNPADKAENKRNNPNVAAARQRLTLMESRLSGGV